MSHLPVSIQCGLSEQREGHESFNNMNPNCFHALKLLSHLHPLEYTWTLDKTGWEENLIDCANAIHFSIDLVT